MVPPLVASGIVAEPKTVQLVITLLVAPLINRMVLVSAVALVLVFEMVNVFPPVFNPLMVTLSAPFKSISGNPAVAAPLTVLAAPPLG